jgi:putative N6-adenine-specific DNA methylase
MTRPAFDPRRPPLHAFAASAPGLEDLLASEVRALGGRDVAPEPGGVAFVADAASLASIHVGVGLALDVWVHVARFSAPHFARLEREAQRIPWRDLLPPRANATVRATCRRSRLYHSGAVVERVLGAVRGAVGAPDDTTPSIEVRVRVVKDVATVSIGTAGAPLTQRGYRRETSKAPLREDLARAALVLAGWPERDGPLVDPMCGSGTLLVEGALLAGRRAPGLDRAFAAERLPFLDAEAFARARAQAAAQIRPLEGRVRGSDRDAGAVEIARRNAARAGFDLEIERAPLSAAPALVDPPPAGLWCSNPPHGGRVSRGRDLRPLYQTLGVRFRELPPGWRLALVVADLRLARATGVPLSPRLTTDHGGRKIHLLTSA